MTHPWKRLSRSLTLALALCLPLAGGAGEARGADTATAQVLFDEAKKLMAAGKHAEACPKLEESQKLDPGVGTQYNLASCYEQIGRVASAWSLFIEVAATSKAAGQPEREKVARQRAAALEPKLTRLAVNAPANAPADLKVTRDGQPIGQAQWGTAVPVDPGKHTVTAQVPGRVPFTATVELTEPGATTAVDITSPDTWASAAAPLGPRQEGEGTTAPPPDEPVLRRKSMPFMVTGIVVTSLGVISASVGSLVLLGTCPSEVASEDGGSKSIDCDQSRRTGVGLTVAGVIGVAAGIPLMVYGGRKVQVNPAPQGAATLLIGPGGAALRWTM